MRKNSFMIVLWALFSNFAFAETCPSIHAIQSQTLAGWQAYDSIDGNPLTKKDFTAFKRHISQFALAEWSLDKQKGIIHCFYRDTSGSYLEAFLAKDHFGMPHSSHWYPVSGGLHCAAGENNCSFQQQA